jgi:hypothetical protein
MTLWQKVRKMFSRRPNAGAFRNKCQKDESLERVERSQREHLEHSLKENAEATDRLGRLVYELQRRRFEERHQ